MTAATLEQLSSRVATLGSQVGGIEARRRIEAAARKPRADPATILIRSLAVRLAAHVGNRDPADMVGDWYGASGEVEKLIRDPAAFLLRAATSPAMTTIADWAAPLVGDGFASTISMLAPRSAYAQLAARALAVDFSGVGTVRLPARSDSGTVSGAWLAEGAAIPLRKLGLSATNLIPSKLGVISAYTREMLKHSAPSIEAILRDQMATDTAIMVDATMLGSAPAAPPVPGGLLAGVVPIPASTGIGLEAMVEDMGALAAAIPGAADLTFVMAEAQRVKALLYSPGVAPLIVVTSSLPAATVVCLDAADLAVSEGITPLFDVSEDAALVNESGLPVPDFGTAPTISAFQQAFLALRMLQEVAFAMRRSGRIAVVENVTW